MEKIIIYKGIKILLLVMLNTGMKEEPIPVKINPDGSVIAVYNYKYIKTHTLKVFVNDSLLTTESDLTSTGGLSNLFTEIDNQTKKAKELIDYPQGKPKPYEMTLEEKLSEKGFVEIP